MSVSTNALTTLDAVKEYYGMTGSKQSDDDLIENLIDRVTELFQSYCNVNAFKAKNYTEYLDGMGSKYLFVNNVPINSITSIHDDDEWDFTTDDLVDSSSYRIVDKKYIVNKDYLFSLGDQNIKIVYNAGYSAIPYDLENACIEEVVRRYRHRRDVDVRSKTLDDGTVQYESKNLLHSTRIVLSKYRNNWVY